MKKAISMMLATAMAATCLAGCGSAASSSAAASSEAASSEATSAATSEASTGEKTFENNELNIAVFEGGYGSDYWDEIIKRFEDAYPGVTVNMQISPKIGDIMKDIIGITFVLALSGTINLSFVLSQVMTGGGPNGASSVLLQYMYTQGFVNGNFGYAMAITVFTLAISVALSMLSRKLTDASEGGQ